MVFSRVPSVDLMTAEGAPLRLPGKPKPMISSHPHRLKATPTAADRLLFAIVERSDEGFLLETTPDAPIMRSRSESHCK
ncbi:MAG: hypothetical protein WCV00_06705 [Verrucomicrobiia bacterium]|jgi:hypothetical protein